MKTTRLIAAIAMAFAAMTATAKPELKVTVTAEHKDAASGYCIEYTINGVPYRSDCAAQRVNQIAWENMSDDDRKKTMLCVFGALGHPEQQFGVRFADEMQTWYRDASGLTEAKKILVDRLIDKEYPGLTDRLGNSAAYYEENFRTDWEKDGADGVEYPEFSELQDQKILLWECAREAYVTLGNALYIRTSAATKCVCGDLIQLICDRVLVPNITPSGMLSGIDAIPSKILGSILDTVNSLTGASDSLVKVVVGEKATADKATEVMNKAKDIADKNYSIIQKCIEGVKEINSTMDSAYKSSKRWVEARYAEAEQHKKDLAERFAADMGELVPDETLKAQRDALDAKVDAAKAVLDSAATALANFEKENPNVRTSKELDRLENAVSSARGAYEAAQEERKEWLAEQRGIVLDKVNAWCEKYYVHFYDNTASPAFQTWIDRSKALVNPDVGYHGLSTNFSAVLTGYNLNVTPAEVGTVIAEAKEYAKAYEKYFEDCYKLNDELAEFASTLHLSGGPLIRELIAVAAGNDKVIAEAEEQVSLALSAARLMAGTFDYYGEFQIYRDLSNCHFTKVYEPEEHPRVRRIELEIERLQPMFDNYQKTYKWMKEILDNMNDEYLQAADDFQKKMEKRENYDSTVPLFVSEQRVAVGTDFLLLNEDTVLGREFLAKDAPGTAKSAEEYRKKLDGCVKMYNDLVGDINAQYTKIQGFKARQEAYRRLYDSMKITPRAAELKKVANVKAFAKVNAIDPLEFEKSEVVKALFALRDDFHNMGGANTFQMYNFFDLCSGYETFTTDIYAVYDPDDRSMSQELWEMLDPYLYRRLCAYCCSRPVEEAYSWGKWFNPSVLIYGPSYGQSYQSQKRSYAYEYSRSLGSYAYHAPGYLESFDMPDPFNDLVKPVLDEIDGVRAAAAGMFCLLDIEPNGGTIAEFLRITKLRKDERIGDSFKLIPLVIRSGYDFGGWFTERVGGVKVTEDTIVTGDLTIYAHWIDEKTGEEDVGGGGQGGGSGGGSGGGTVVPKPTDAPTLFAAGKAETPFMGDATYNGWVRNADGSLAGLLTVKAAKAAKPEKGGQSKLTITYTPFGGKKQTIKLANDAMPVAGGVATVAIPGVGTVKFTGDALVGVNVDVQAGKDMLKSRDKGEKAAATAAAASKAGVWTFALGTDAGYAAFSVTVDKKGKGKLAGTLPDGTKVSVSAQGVLGDGVLAIPFTYAKKGTLGFVFWVNGDGTAALSDLTGDVGGSPGTARPTMVAPSASHRLADGEHVFTAGDVSQAFTVAGKKWNVPKQNKRAEVDPNPTGLKLAFTEKTGVVKGTFTVVNGKAKTKYTVVGAVVGGKFYGSAYVRNAVPIPATAE